jgi:hypothetical protein
LNLLKAWGFAPGVAPDEAQPLVREFTFKDQFSPISAASWIALANSFAAQA